MKATLKSHDGTTKGHIDLPSQFHEDVRPDLIKRAVLAIQSHKMQPHGTDPEAGQKYQAKLSRRRRDYKTAYGIGISRVPRKILSYRGTRFNWQGATIPGTVGGREAHPPKAEKLLQKKINTKERRKAIRSAMAASVIKELVSKRGHVVEEYPLVLETSVEDMKKTKDVLTLLAKLGLEKELERSSKKRMNTGKARLRGRSTKKTKGPLFVVSKRCDFEKAAINIPGVDIVEVSSLNVELLAPGCDYGRLTLYTEAAIETIGKRKLFTDNQLKAEKTEEKPVAKKTVKKAVAEEKPKATKKKESKK